MLRMDCSFYWYQAMIKCGPSGYPSLTTSFFLYAMVSFHERMHVYLWFKNLFQCTDWWRELQEICPSWSLLLLLTLFLIQRKKVSPSLRLSQPAPWQNTASPLQWSLTPLPGQSKKLFSPVIMKLLYVTTTLYQAIWNPGQLHIQEWYTVKNATLYQIDISIWIKVTLEQHKISICLKMKEMSMFAGKNGASEDPFWILLIFWVIYLFGTNWRFYSVGRREPNNTLKNTKWIMHSLPT